MSKPIAIVVGLLLLALLTLFSATYTVNYHQVAIKSRFGRTNGEESIIRDRGLKFRLPFFADRVKKLDTRLQLTETKLETIPTADGQQVVVRAYLLWQVDEEGEGPLRFFESFESTTDAKTSLSDQFGQALSVLSRYSFAELVGDQTLPEAEAALLAEMGSVRSDKGVMPVSVGISQMMLPPKTSTGVLSRMRATQTRRSENERIRGDAEAKEIESYAGAVAQKINAFSLQRAAEIRAAGDERAAGYLKEMSQDKELAIFLTQLEALKAALGDQTTVILDTAFAPWHLMDRRASTDERGIPQPAADLVRRPVVTQRDADEAPDVEREEHPIATAEPVESNEGEGP